MSKGIYHVTLRGEDGSIFTREFSGSPESILKQAEEHWPEATVLDWFDPDVRGKDIYDRAQRDYDNDYLYDD